MQLKYKTIETDLDIKNLIENLISVGEFVFDIETNGLETHSDTTKIVGLGFCYKAGEAYYVPFNEVIAQSESAYRTRLHLFKEVLEDPTIRKIGHNTKFDCRTLDYQNITVKGIYFDTMIAHYCLYNDRFPHNLDDIALHLFNYIKIRTKSLITNGTKTKAAKTMLDAPVNDVAVYCMEDCDFTWRAYEVLKKELELPQNQFAKKLFWEIEQPLVPILTKMECSGVKIDTAFLDSLRQKIAAEQKIIIDELKEISGEPEFAISNHNQISNIIYNKLQLDKINNIVVKTTAKGKLRTDEETLEAMKGHPFIDKLKVAQQINKLLTTYVVPIPTKVNPQTGLLHAWFNQSVTSTGRLSGADPNLQNIPARTELGKEVRGAFISRFSNGVITAADYSQFEFRILAHMANDEYLIEAFKAGKDLHISVASKIYKVLEDKVTKAQRNNTKTLNYGLLYGMGDSKLARETNMSLNAAKAFIKTYFSVLPGVKRFIDESAENLKKYGYTETIFGRRRYIPAVYSDKKYEMLEALRQGTNHRVQGTNADAIKLAMKRVDTCYKEKNLKSCLVMQVHDELVTDTHPDEINIVKEILLREMSNAIVLKVPVIVDVKSAKNWKEAH